MFLVRLARPVTALVAALAVALGGAACGGDGAGSGLGSGADVAPAATAFFLSLNTDFEGDQWQTAGELLRKFPGGQDALRSVLSDMRDDDVDFERDVKPAVGPEVDFVLVDFEDEDSWVFLTQPRDEAKLQELVRKGDDPGVAEEIDDGWWAAAETQEAIDAFKEARGDESLGETDSYADVAGKLPDDALGRAYVSGAALAEELRAETTSDDERAALDCALGGGEVPSLAFALGAQDEGLRIASAVDVGDRELPDESASDLDETVPEGALAFISTSNVAGSIRELLRCVSDANEDAARQLAQIELALGVSVEEDLLPLFEGETAIAVYAPVAGVQGFGATIPPAVLVTEIEDEAEAMDIVEKIAARASAFLPEVQVDEVDVAGVQARRVSFGGQPYAFFAAFDGKLVLATTEEALRGVREGPKLADDPAYEGAREAADAPDEAMGYVYVNVEDAAGVALNALGAEGGAIPPEVAANIEPLRALFLWGGKDGDTATSEGLLGID